ANASSGTPYATTPHSATPHPATPHPASYQRTRAPPVDDADLAPRPACDAHAPPVQDERVREPGPPVARHEHHEVSLDFHRILLPGEAEQGGQALYVRVHHDPFILPEPRPQHHVRGLAADARELDQGLHGVGHFAPVLLEQALRHPDDGPGLVPEKPGTVNLLLQHRR